MMAVQASSELPLVHVIGLGPGGPDLITSGTIDLINRIETQFLRTERHPAAVAMPHARWFDRLYETSASFDDVYRSIRDAVVRSAYEDLEVLYAVPGSPVVAERSVQLLIDDERIRTIVHPAMSFLDLAWARLGVDPVALAAQLIDGHHLDQEVRNVTGPVLIAQCDSRFVLSDIKLGLDGLAPAATLLHHLGLHDEQVCEVMWEDLDRTLQPDHLTSVWVGNLVVANAARRRRSSRTFLGRTH